ncbi:hypothetical protein Tco_1293687, partial [Tanacetum coccineum]
MCSFVTDHLCIDRTDFVSLATRIRLCFGEGVLTSKYRYDRVYSDLSPEDKERYNADIRATNILLQGLPKDIYSFINNYTDAKDIWDKINARGAGAASFGGAQNRFGVNANSRSSNVGTMFMANLSSADHVYDEAGPSYDLVILSEVHNHDHYQDGFCEHREEYEMHDDVQPTYVVDSHANYTSDKHFEGIQNAPTKEIKEVKDMFEELEAEVDQNVIDRKHDEIERKNLLIANDNLIADCLSKEVFHVASNSELNVS